MVHKTAISEITDRALKIANEFSLSPAETLALAVLVTCAEIKIIKRALQLNSRWGSKEVKSSMRKLLALSNFKERLSAEQRRHHKNCSINIENNWLILTSEQRRKRNQPPKQPKTTRIPLAIVYPSTKRSARGLLADRLKREISCGNPETAKRLALELQTMAA